MYHIIMLYGSVQLFFMKHIEHKIKSNNNFLVFLNTKNKNDL